MPRLRVRSPVTTVAELVAAESWLDELRQAMSTVDDLRAQGPEL